MLLPLVLEQASLVSQLVVICCIRDFTHNLKHSTETILHIHMIMSHNFSKFVKCTFIMSVTDSHIGICE